MPSPLMLARALALGLSMLGASAAQAVDAVEGALDLGPDTVALTHGAAWVESRVPEMRAAGDPDATILVVLTNRAIPANLHQNEGAIAFAAAQGEVEGVILSLDPATGAILNGQSLGAPDRAIQSPSFAGDPVRMRIEGFAAADGTVSGRIVSDGRLPASRLPDDPNPVDYALNARFTLTLPPPPKLEAVFDGPAAKASAPGAAFAAFVAAVDTAQPGRILPLIQPGHPARDFVTASPAEARGSFLGGFSADVLAAAVAKVYEYDTHATIIVEPGDGTMALDFVKVGGVWMLGAP